MEKIQLDIVGLSYSQSQSSAYALLLNEKNGNRRLPIIIGGFEAQAIAIELEGMTPSRPLTHDLFTTFAKEFDIDVEEVIIYNLVEGIFFSKLICKGKDGTSVEIDARTSDAIALAVRFDAPIYAYEFILSSAGIILDDKDADEFGAFIDEDEDEPELVAKQGVDSMSDKELQEQLDMAIEDEDYERASKIRDELNKRQSN